MYQAGYIYSSGVLDRGYYGSSDTVEGVTYSLTDPIIPYCKTLELERALRN
jgi:hypothetical protein